MHGAVSGQEGRLGAPGPSRWSCSAGRASGRRWVPNAIGLRRSPRALADFGTALDPGTQPCYAAAMPDTDSRPLVVPLIDPSTMSRLRMPRLFEGAAAHRFARSCNELGLIFGCRAAFDEAGLPSLTEINRGLLDDCTIDLPGAGPAPDSRLTELHGSLTSSVASDPVSRPMRRIA
jgi:hypothetical protein